MHHIHHSHFLHFLKEVGIMILGGLFLYGIWQVIKHVFTVRTHPIKQEIPIKTVNPNDMTIEELEEYNDQLKTCLNALNSHTNAH